MTQRRGQYTFGVQGSPMGTFGAILTLALVLFGIYFLIKGAYFVLGIIAPVLLIATLIMDHKVVTNYLKFLFETIKKNPVMGLVFTLLTVLGAPFVAGYLFAKAWMKRSLKKYMVEQPGQEKYSEYEEVKEIVVEDEDFLILPEIEKAPKEVKKDTNDYEDLFD
jgi:hypothetical protein